MGTFLNVATKVQKLPAYCWMKDVGYLLLRPIVTRHDDNQLSHSSSSWGSKDRCSDEVGVWQARQERIDLSYSSECQYSGYGTLKRQQFAPASFGKIVLVSTNILVLVGFDS